MEQQELDIARYLRVLWDRKWLVVLTTVAGLAAAWVAIQVRGDQAGPELGAYTGTALVRMDKVTPPTGTGQAAATRQAEVAVEALKHIEQLMRAEVVEKAVTQLRALDSGQVAAPPTTDDVISEAQIWRLGMTAQYVPGTITVQVNVRGPTQVEANRRAQAVSSAYVEFTKEQQVRSVRNSIAAIEGQLGTAETALISEELRRQLSALATDLSSAKAVVEDSAGQLGASSRVPQGADPAYQAALVHMETGLSRLERLASELDRIERRLTAEDQQAVPAGQVPAVLAELAALLEGDLLADLNTARTSVLREAALPAAREATAALARSASDLTTISIELDALAVKQAEEAATSALAAVDASLRSLVIALNVSSPEVQADSQSGSQTKAAVNQVQVQISAATITANRIISTIAATQRSPLTTSGLRTLTADVSTLNDAVQTMITGLGNIRRSADVSSFTIENISKADARLRQASSEVIASNTRLGSVAGLSSGSQLKSIASDLSVLAEANGQINAAISPKLAANSLTEQDLQLLHDQSRAARSGLNATVLEIASVRANQASGAAFAALVEAETRSRGVSESIASSETQLSQALQPETLRTLADVRTRMGVVAQSVQDLATRLGPADPQAPATAQSVTDLKSISTALQGVIGLLDSRVVSTDGGNAQADVQQLRTGLTEAADKLRGAELGLTRGSGPDPVFEPGRVAALKNNFLSITVLIGTARDSLVKMTDGSAPLDQASLDTVRTQLSESKRRIDSLKGLLQAASTALTGRSSSSDFSALATQSDGAAGSVNSAASALESVAPTTGTTPTARLSTAGSRLSALDANLGAIVELARPGDERRPAQEVASALTEVKVRLAIADKEMKVAIDEITSASAASDASSQVRLALITDRLTNAKVRVTDAVVKLPKLEAAAGPSREVLLRQKDELETSLLRPAEATVSSAGLVAGLGTSLGASLARKKDVQYLLGGLAGFLLGVAGSLAIEQADKRVRRIDDLRRIPGLPVLGLVPIGKAKGNPHPPEVTDDPTSLFANAVHAVSLNVEELIRKGEGTLLVTSARPREGKTALSVNIARSLALRGRKVLVVDADLTVPDVSLVMAVNELPGLADALEKRLDPALFVTERDGLRVLPGGKSDVPAIELLSRPGLAAFLQKARQEYDAVIIDGPPALGFSETLGLARDAKSVLLAVRVKAAAREVVQNASDTLRAAGAANVAGVLTFVSPGDMHYASKSHYADKYKKKKRKTVLSLIRVWKN